MALGPSVSALCAVLATAAAACAPEFVDRGGPGPGSDDGGGSDGPGPDGPGPDGPGPDGPGPDGADDDDLIWRLANLTNFTSYPEPGSEECEEFNGCTWAGHFAFVDGQQSEAWVMSHNIAAVHSDDGDEFALRTLRVRDEDRTIDVVVYDVCSDADCDGCCTRNASETGFLIDLELYTAERFGTWHGVVEWACLDCDDS